MDRGFVFDHSVLLQSGSSILSGLQELLDYASSNDIGICVLSTNPLDLDSELGSRGLTCLAALVTQADVPGGKAKGSPAWLVAAASVLGLDSHHLLFVGDDIGDWRSAINAATLYLHADWAGAMPSGSTSLRVPRPQDARDFASHFLLPPPRWGFSLDLPSQHVNARSLLDVNVSLAASSPTSSFDLKQVLKYETRVMVASNSARDLLGMHAISSLYLEGLIEPNAFFAVYPGSRRGGVNQVLAEFVVPAAKFFHGYYRDDLLVRHTDAVDTSMERYRARQERRDPQVSFTTQANSVCLNPAYARTNRLSRPVIVFDDFSTTGMSLEWARNLLLAGGAASVTTVSIGKYGSAYTIFTPKHASTVEPFTPKRYEDSDFQAAVVPMAVSPDAGDVLKESFMAWRDDQPLVLDG